MAERRGLRGESDSVASAALFSVQQVMSPCVESDFPSGCFERLCLYNEREQLHVAVVAMVISHWLVMSVAHRC